MNYYLVGFHKIKYEKFFKVRYVDLDNDTNFNLIEKIRRNWMKLDV